jgi:dolichol-phosphate mannosyltransferase
MAVIGILFTLLQRVFSNYFTSIGIGPVAGYPTIVISILFLGGVQLLCLGILGEYLGRIYEEVKRRPQWVIRSAVNLETQTPKL